jgi:RimJ/RimL family protein N-acetyltransferase
MNESRSDFLFGIFLSKTGQHIGNIKIGQIHPVHRYADVGLLIGERTCRGRGYGTQAIVLATSYAFSELHLNSLTAGIYAPNLSSYRAFIKAGWEDAGRYRRHRFFEGSFIDQINVQKCNEI